MLIHFSLISSFLIFIPTLILLRKSPNESTSTFTLAQLGHVSLCVARSTCIGFPTAAAKENTSFFPKKFRGKARKDIHATTIEVF